MKQPKKSRNPNRTELVRIMALIEENLDEIDKEHEAASAYHRSELVEVSRDNAQAALKEAVQFLALEDFPKAEREAAAAWFYTDFARNILDAEFTEHHLGEDVFLDLVPTRESVKHEISSLMNDLKTELNGVYESLAVTEEQG
ncbi:MAG: hypothetical protein SFV17_21575 [Candidatus Obscuribacter sp.]|nr:hypothetical protein [Candidatus Melainabacteria bacterium]MDX1989291.1 hypothetical protein [Candidatus Obscuribacter sp.]